MLTGSFTATGQSQPFTILREASINLIMSGTNVVDLEWDNAGTWVPLRRYSAGTSGADSEIEIGEVARCRLNCTTFDTNPIYWSVGGNILADEYTNIEGLYSLLDEAGEDILAEDGTYLFSEAA